MLDGRASAQPTRRVRLHDSEREIGAACGFDLQLHAIRPPQRLIGRPKLEFGGTRQIISGKGTRCEHPTRGLLHRTKNREDSPRWRGSGAQLESSREHARPECERG
jgi:hypothetical protein